MVLYSSLGISEPSDKREIKSLKTLHDHNQKWNSQENKYNKMFSEMKIQVFQNKCLCVGFKNRHVYKYVGFVCVHTYRLFT